MQKILKMFLLASILVIGGCAKNISPNVYSTDDTGVVSRVSKGVIISKRIIKFEGQSGVGAIAGGVAGGAAGSTIGGSGAANVVGAVGGAVAAGVIGHEIDKAVNRRTGYEYIIKLEDSKTISVAQEKSIQLAVGQKVLVIYGPTTRIVPDNSINK